MGGLWIVLSCGTIDKDESEAAEVLEAQKTTTQDTANQLKAVDEVRPEELRLEGGESVGSDSSVEEGKALCADLGEGVTPSKKVLPTTSDTPTEDGRSKAKQEAKEQSKGKAVTKGAPSKTVTGKGRKARTSKKAEAKIRASVRIKAKTAVKKK